MHLHKTFPNIYFKIFIPTDTIKHLQFGLTRIIANTSGIANWSLNVTSNSKNFKIFGKDPKGNDIEFGTTSGKFMWHISKERSFMYEIVIRIGNVTTHDEGPYTLQVALDGVIGQKRTINLYLAVRGNKLLD